MTTKPAGHEDVFFVIRVEVTPDATSATLNAIVAIPTNAVALAKEAFTTLPHCVEAGDRYAPVANATTQT